MTYSYTVRATFTTAAVREEWINWLREMHLREVCEAGAMDAEVVRLDGETLICEVRYHFESRAAFAAYEKNHAPRLREDGLKRFPPERGVTYARGTGEVVARFPH